MSHIPSIVDHARVAVMTFPSPPSLPLSRPWAGWVRGYHCSRSSWFRDHQSPHLLPKFPLSHLDIWQKIWLWAFLPSILHHFLKLVKLQAFSPSCLLVCTALCECEYICVSVFFSEFARLQTFPIHFSASSFSPHLGFGLPYPMPLLLHF